MNADGDGHVWVFYWNGNTAVCKQCRVIRIGTDPDFAFKRPENLDTPWGGAHPCKPIQPTVWDRIDTLGI